MKYPLIFPIISFLIGVLFIDNIESIFYLKELMPVILMLLILSIISLVLLRNKIKLFYLTLCLFFFLLGIFRYATVMSHLENDICKYISNIPKRCMIYGTIISEPEWRGPFYARRLVFILKAERLLIDGEEKIISGDIYVRLFKEKERALLFIGDNLIINGKIRALFNRKKVKVVMSSSRKDYYLRTGVKQNAFLQIRRFISKIRHRARNGMAEYLSGYARSITEAVVLGFRDDMKDEINDIFIKTGTMHILSVSGFHVGIVAICLILVLRLVWCPEKLRYLLTISGISLYSIFTGCQPPAIRASLMGSCVIFSLLLGRRIDTLNALGFSAFLVVFFQPQQLFILSFVLSYLAVLSIIYLMPITDNFLGIRNYKNYIMRYFLKSISLSLSVWIGTAPVIASYFCIVTPSVVLANLIAVPIFFIVVALGFVLFLTSSSSLSFLLPITKLIGDVLDVIISNFINIMEILSQIPLSSINISALNRMFVFLSYILLVGGVLLFNKKHIKNNITT